MLVGSIFLLVAQPPSATLQHWVAPYTPMLLVPYRMLGGVIAIWVAYGAAHSLAKSYGLDASAVLQSLARTGTTPSLATAE